MEFFQKQTPLILLLFYHLFLKILRNQLKLIYYNSFISDEKLGLVEGFRLQHLYMRLLKQAGVFLGICGLSSFVMTY